MGEDVIGDIIAEWNTKNKQDAREACKVHVSRILYDIQDKQALIRKLQGEIDAVKKSITDLVYVEPVNISV
jgi:hypothetical protein